MKTKFSFRKLMNTIHLWLGLSSGLVLFVVCLSGTLYTFRAEIERWTNSEKYYVKETGNGIRLPVDSLVRRLEKQLHGKVVSIQVPSDATMNWQLGIKTVKAGNRSRNNNEAGAVKEQPRGEGRGVENRAAGKGENASRPGIYFVNPYTGAIAGKEGGSSTRFFTTVMQLHRWLLLKNSVGSVIVGIATLIFVFLILSGLVIWFPARLKNWKQGLKIRFKANWKRVNHDLHNTLGFYSFILLLIMSLTGLCWSFEWYRNGMSSVLGAKVFKGRNEKPLASSIAGTANIPIDQHLASAQLLFPYQGNYRITLPDDSTSAVVINKSATGFFAFSGADKVQYDRYTGAALKVERFSDKPFNVRIADSIRPLHTGEIFGTFSKLFYFIACLIATSLPVTGTLIWFNKRKKKSAGNKTVVPAANPVALAAN